MPSVETRCLTEFRVEGLFEDAQTLRSKVAAYLALLRGETHQQQLLRKLGAVERYGVTDGQLYNIRSYHDRKKAFTSLDSLGAAADPGLAYVQAVSNKT
jgi:putative protease